MTYITPAHIDRALPEGGSVADWSGGESSKVEQAIEAAQGEIDGYLISGGYAVPLDSPPANIVNYTVDIAVYNLAVTSGFRSDSADIELRTKYEKAIEFLRGVASGKYRIPVVPTGCDVPGASSAGIRVRSAKKMDMRGYF